jgi:hypothetical protein
MFSTILDGIDLAGVVVTADAFDTQHPHPQDLHGQSAYYVLTIKGNQPGPQFLYKYIQYSNLKRRNISPHA